MKHTIETAQIYLKTFDSKAKKREFLYAREEQTKNSGNSINPGLSPKDKAFLDWIRDKLNELSEEPAESYPAPKSFTKYRIYHFYDQLKKERNLSVKDAHQFITDVLQKNGLNPATHHVNEDPDTFNRKVNNYLSNKRKQES